MTNDLTQDVRIRLVLDRSSVDAQMGALRNSLQTMFGSLGAHIENALATGAMAGSNAAAKSLTMLEGIGKRTGATIGKAIGSGIESGVEQGAKKAVHEIEKVERQARTTNPIQSLFAKMGGGMALGAGLMGAGLLGAQTMGMHQSRETQQAGLASLLSAVGGMDRTSAVMSGQDLAKQLSMDAAKGVGETSNYVEGASRVLQPVLAAGGNLAQVRDLTRLSLAAGFALQGQEGMQYAPNDIRQAMTGSASRQTPIVAAALDAIGMSTETFNKMGQDGKLEALTRGFGKFGDAVDIMGRTSEARLATLREHLGDIYRSITRPLFDRWSGWIDRANAGLDAMKPKIDQITSALATGGDRAFGQGLAGAPGAVLAGGSVWGASKMGFGAIPVAAKAAGAEGGVGAAWGTWGANLGASFQALAAPAALLAVVVGAVVGAFMEFPTMFPMVFDAFMYLWQSVTGLGAMLAQMFAPGSVFNLAGMALILIFVGLTYVLGGVVRGVVILGEVFAGVVRVFGFGVQLLWDSIIGLIEKIPGVGDMSGWKFGVNGGSFQGVFDDLTNNLNQVLFGGAPQGQGGPDEFGRYPESPTGTGGLPKAKHITNIGKVEVRVEREVNADPTRVAATFETILKGVQRAGRQARGGLPRPA